MTNMLSRTQTCKAMAAHNYYSNKEVQIVGIVAGTRELCFIQACVLEARRRGLVGENGF